MKNFGYCRNFSKAFLAILSISEIALSFRLSIRGTPLYGHISKSTQSAGLSTYIQQETMMRKTYLSAVIAETKGSRGGSLLTPIYRRLKWFVTLLRHIVQLIVRSFANIDKEEKNNDVGRKLPDITEADDDILEIEGPGVVAIERENVQRIVKAEPRLTPSYVPNHERKEADKSYAERKLQEIENLQIEAQNSRMARKAKEERDVMWAQSSLNNNEKRAYSDSEGGDGEGSPSNGFYDKNRGRNGVEDAGDSSSADGKAERTVGKTPDTSKISKANDAIKSMKASNKEVIKSTSEVEEEKNFKQAKKEKEAVPAPEGEAEAPPKFSSKPNLNVILKRSLKDSLYSINVNGFYSNNGTAFAETKNSDMIPLVRNSLLLSEKVELEKKLGSKKSTGVIGKDNTLILDPTVEASDGKEIEKGDGYSEEYDAGDVELLKVTEDEISKLKSELVVLQKEESLLLDDNEYLLPPAVQPDTAVQAAEGESSLPPTFWTGTGTGTEEQSAAVTPQADSDLGALKDSEFSAASVSASEEGAGSKRQVPDYAEDSIERLLQKQQAEEYEDEFLEPSSLSSTSPSAAILASPPSFAVLLPSSFSSPSDDSYPLNPPLSLLGEWELAEQRYLTSDRSSLSDFYMDTISFPSFGSLSSSLSGSKGTEWGTKKRSKEDSREGEDLEVFTLPRSGADSEEYEVEFNVIRGCSSTEWMKGQGRHEKTITARIIKPPKEAYEQRPTLCTYTGVLTSPNSIRGYVYSTAITIEGERQLVGEFEMVKLV